MTYNMNSLIMWRAQLIRSVQSHIAVHLEWYHSIAIRRTSETHTVELRQEMTSLATSGRVHKKHDFTDVQTAIAQRSCLQLRNRWVSKCYFTQTFSEQIWEMWRTDLEIAIQYRFRR